MPALSEPEILDNAIKGDKEAFRWIVDKYQNFAIAVSYRFLGDVHEAEDAAQDAFIRLWKNMSKYRPEVKITTWLYKIITNLCLDHLKSRHRKQSVAAVRLDDDMPVRSREEADGRLIEEELQNAVLKMTEALTPKQKAVFILRDIEELPVDEVSTILSMSAANVKGNLYHARVKMSELIARYYQEEKKRTA